MENTPQKICRACGNANPPQARFCNNCGAALGANGIPHNNTNTPPPYDPRFGENDLVESDTSWAAGPYVFGTALIVSLLACGVFAFVGTGNFSPAALIWSEGSPTPTADSAAAPVQATLNTNTPRPTRQFATVTPAPPTATTIPTEGPCAREVTANAPTNTLIGIISTCGHRDLDVIDEVLELNGLTDASALSVGQVIEVPRPTQTPDPNQALTDEADDETGETDNETSSSDDTNSFSSVLFAEGADGLPTFTPTVPPTLPPGIQWHTVVKDETIIAVVNRYGAGVEVLSQINPEMTFSQCEFNPDMPYGGPSCTVMLFEGMRIRVPAPTPTPTLSPTPSGSETPTPSPSATFNAPNLVSPGNRVLFTQGELITLRWSGTGTLSPDDVYRVTVRNLGTGITYETNTRDTTLILPREWQERDGERYDYEWQVSLLNQNTPDTPRFFTETRIFTWEATEAGGE